MAGLILCVLIQVLLITVYSSESEKKIFTCNHFTVAKGLRLTCNVTCDMKCTSERIWRTADGSKIACIDEQFTNKTSIYSCTVPKAVKNNGTFKFWVQMITGPREFSFSVTTESSTSAQQQNKGGRSSMVALAVVVISCLVIVIMGAVFLRRKKDNIVPNLALFTQSTDLNSYNHNTQL